MPIVRIYYIDGPMARLVYPSLANLTSDTDKFHSMIGWEFVESGFTLPHNLSEDFELDLDRQPEPAKRSFNLIDKRGEEHVLVEVSIAGEPFDDLAKWAAEQSPEKDVTIIIIDSGSVLL